MPKQISQGKYLNLFVSDYGYEYVHDRTGNLVAVLPFRVTSDVKLEFIGRFEPRSAWGPGDHLSSVTGGVEEGEAPLDAGVRELYEEVGLSVSPEEMLTLGTCHNAKALDTLVHLYAVDASGREAMRNGPGDGTEGEKQSYNEWVGLETILNEAGDPLLSVMLTRLLVQLGKTYPGLILEF